MTLYYDIFVSLSDRREHGSTNKALRLTLLCPVHVIMKTKIET
jgi:hypothetical protein